MKYENTVVSQALLKRRKRRQAGQEQVEMV